MAKNVKRSVKFTLLITKQEGRSPNRSNLTQINSAQQNVLIVAKKDSGRRKVEGLKGKLRWYSVIYQMCELDSKNLID